MPNPDILVATVRTRSITFCLIAVLAGVSVLEATVLHGRRFASAILVLLFLLASQLGNANAADDAKQTRVGAAADSYVVEEQPDQTYGGNGKLSASNWPHWHTTTYLRFVVPDNESTRATTAAKLQLALTFRQPAKVELRAVTGSWNEQTLTYANRPAPGAVLATAGGGGSQTALSIDLTGTVRGPGTYDFAIVNPTANSALAARSSEYEDAAERPALVLSSDPKATEPPPDGTLCGASFDTEGQSYGDALGKEDQLFNGLELVRVFYGALPAWKGSKADTAGRAVNVSFKYNPSDIVDGTYDAYLRSWFKSVPRDRTVYWTYYHEPEDNIRAGEFSAAGYRNAWKHLKQLADQAGNPHLHSTLVLMQWSLSKESGRDWRDYYAGPETIDVLGWDVYNYKSRVDKGEYRTPAEMFDQIIQISEQENRPWAVAEFGSHLAKGDSGAKRAAWLRASAAYATRHKALYVAYFDLDWSTGDYRLRDTASQAAWQEFCS
ncbi:CBM96 family carbohydrate-binding protein [Flindersiella endophytica]